RFFWPRARGREPGAAPAPLLFPTAYPGVLDVRPRPRAHTPHRQGRRAEPEVGVPPPRRPLRLPGPPPPAGQEGTEEGPGRPQSHRPVPVQPGERRARSPRRLGPPGRTWRPCPRPERVAVRGP